MPINNYPDDSERDTVFVSIANQASGSDLSSSHLLEAGVSEDPFIGSTIDSKYEIQEKIGQGGMSVVYRAMQVTMHRVVALKMLKMGLTSDPNFVQRFSREVAFLGRLNHRNIVTVFDSGVSAEGYLYLAMDLLSGPTLQEILDRNEIIPVARAQNITLQICDALNHAHKRDITHRDLKPGNVIIEADDRGNDIVKIVDFGLAKMGEGSERLTKAGELWGSSFYMSPEQCNGSESDIRSDIYSFGILIYYMMCGRLPFRGKTFMETIAKQINEKPPSFKESNPKVEISDVLEKIVLRCLEKSPADRYQTVSELKAALSAIFPASAQTTSEANSARQISNAMPKPKSPPRSMNIGDHDRIPEKKSNAGKALIVLILVILVCGGAIAFVMMNVKSTTPQGVPTVAPPKATTSVPKTPVDSGLKTVPLVVPSHPSTTKSATSTGAKVIEHKPPVHKVIKATKKPIRRQTYVDDQYDEPKIKPRREQDPLDILNKR
ncbi:MAG: serine/threonine protein kinase [Leptolyngbya sp.]|nr:serine/threonine protein kinase [Candidatus Melainabacteria bacterium]